MQNHTLRPVTIKQLNDATQAHSDADFKIDGVEVGSVTIVGQVRNISNLTTFVTYKLDDGTGEVEVKFWPDKDEVPDVDSMDTGVEKPPKREVKVNGYARVMGKLGTFNNRRNVTALVARPITDMNEFHCHFLEATAVHLALTRGDPADKQGAHAGVNAASGNMGGMADGGAAGGGPGGKTLPSMSPLARKMYTVMSTTPQSNEGLHVQQIATEMDVPVSEVLRAGEELINLGQIYTTVDDNTWAILDF